jgi:hypothetical protein
MHIRRRTAGAGAALTLALAGSAAMITAAAVPASADAGGSGNGNGSDTVQYCRSIESLFPGNIYGACVSYYNSHDRSAAATDVYFCKTNFVPAGMFDNLGSCVSFLNNFKGT